MPRQARRMSQTGIYHVMLRGINRQQIFEEKEDYEYFFRVLERCVFEKSCRVYAACLMGNHVHLLLQEAEESVPQVMKRIGTRFVYWYNAKYERCGHLFQDRFKSEPVENDTYLLTVVRYIHQNPCRAGLCSRMEEYPYSSFSSYLHADTRSFYDREYIVRLAGGQEAFLAYHLQANSDACLEISERTFMKDGKIRTWMVELENCQSVAEFQALSSTRQKALLAALGHKGASIRQLARLTGVSFAVVRKILTKEDGS